MAIRIGVNGFGRIGRYMTRILAGDPAVDIAVINARAGNEELARLLKYDSVHRTFAGDVGVWSDGITVNGKKITVTRFAAGDWHWKQHNIENVVDTTGKFTERDKAALHLACGAKKVIISAPGKSADCTIVMGVNEDHYDPAAHQIISAASCTTNCLAPVAKVLNDAIGIKHGLMTTIHSYTMSQRILDGSHKDPRRARAACVSLIPTTTGAAKAAGLVIPELAGKLDGYSVRTPTADGSLVDLTCEMARPVSAKEVNALLKSKANDTMGYTDEPLVSVDYLGDTHGGVVDGPLTAVMNETMLKVVIWYDNEAGFTHQLVRLVKHVCKA
ncbi:type I glyceraldehyde-3-phosphate dehydrogenase [Fundidesulfovibrio butyratiphilus]